MSYYSLHTYVDAGGANHKAKYNFTNIDDIKKYLCDELITQTGRHFFGWYGFHCDLLIYKNKKYFKSINLLPYITYILNDHIICTYDDSDIVYRNYDTGNIICDGIILNKINTFYGKEIRLYDVTRDWLHDMNYRDHYSGLITNERKIFDNYFHHTTTYENGGILRISPAICCQHSTERIVMKEPIILNDYVKKDYSVITNDLNKLQFNLPNITNQICTHDELPKIFDKMFAYAENYTFNYTYHINWNSIDIPILTNKLLKQTDDKYGIINNS